MVSLSISRYLQFPPICLFSNTSIFSTSPFSIVFFSLTCKNMSCNNDNIIARDFINKVGNNNGVQNSHKNYQSSSSSETDTNHGREDSRPLDLFPTNHVPKVKLVIQKSTNGRSRKDRKGSMSFTISPALIHNSCSPPVSILDQKLLPRIRCGDANLFPSVDKSQGAQLTIFYQGTVNVYDNVSFDKAKAIMVLAGESSVSAPVVKNEAGINLPNTIQPSFPILQSNLAIPTRNSLRVFFDRRRDRMKKKVGNGTSSPDPPQG